MFWLNFSADHLFSCGCVMLNHGVSVCGRIIGRMQSQTDLTDSLSGNINTQ